MFVTVMEKHFFRRCDKADELFFNGLYMNVIFIFRVEIDPDTSVRLIRSTAVRLVQEGEEIKVGDFFFLYCVIINHLTNF